MGRRHADVLQKLGISLCAVVDPIDAACVEVVNNWQGEGSPATFNNLEHMLQVQSPELLVIAATADVRATQVLAAIDAGVRLIFLEKPVANSLTACKRLRRACELTGTSVAVNHQMRFLPQYQIPKQLFDSPDYGGFHSMNVSAGNFGMSMNGIHYIEAFRFLTGEAPVEVSAWFDAVAVANPRGPQFQDVSGCIRVTTAKGHRLYIDASADQGHGLQVTYMTRNGRITIDELTGEMTTVLRTAEHRDEPTSRYAMPAKILQQQIAPVELIDSTKAVLQALLDGDGYPTLEDATVAVKTLVAAYRSHRQSGVSVCLSDISDDDPEVFPWA